MQRRKFLALFAGAIFPSEQRRYPDPSTEIEVFRLTDPAHTSVLPRHGIARRGNFLIYSSDRGGNFQVYRMDMKSGESRQITEAENLDPRSVALLPNDSGFVFCDGDTLAASGWSGRTRTVAAAVDRSGVPSVSEDSQYCSFAAGKKIQLAWLGAKPSLTTLATLSDGAVLAAIRPRRAQVLYVRADGAPGLVNFTGQGNRLFKLDAITQPEIETVQWTPQGKTFAYLRDTVMREYTPDENADRLLAKTSQFAEFGINADSSVFVGASRSKASPYVLLLLRITRREFTLCEHKSSDPAGVSPVFSPNSQSVLFQSDRHGKQAIYRIRVDKLVESTDDESPIA